MTNAGLQFTFGYQCTGKLAVSGFSDLDGQLEAFLSPFVAGALGGSTLLTWGVKSGTLAAGANVELILNNGSLLDRFGAGITFTVLKAYAVFVTAFTAGGGLRVGNAGTNPIALHFGGTTSTWDIKAIGVPLVGGDATGITVDSTHNRVKLLNLDGTNAVTYSFLYAGDV